MELRQRVRDRWACCEQGPGILDTQTHNALASFQSAMERLFLKGVRYLQCYRDLAFGSRPDTLEEIVDYCVDRPVLMGQVRSEILQLGRIVQELAPRRSLELGTNYGGTLLLLCRISPPGAKIISVDLPKGRFGGGYPRRKIPLFSKFPRAGRQLHLVRGDSHALGTRERILGILKGEPLDYLFIDADHTYAGVRRDFEMYSPLVRSGGIVVFHDIVSHRRETECEVEKFWNEIKRQYRHLEIVEASSNGTLPIAITRAPMETAGLGVLYVP
jgi:predicted O-methyltransferase YrrM